MQKRLKIDWAVIFCLACAVVIPVLATIKDGLGGFNVGLKISASFIMIILIKHMVFDKEDNTQMEISNKETGQRT